MRRLSASLPLGLVVLGLLSACGSTVQVSSERLVGPAQDGLQPGGSALDGVGGTAPGTVGGEVSPGAPAAVGGVSGPTRPGRGAPAAGGGTAPVPAAQAGTGPARGFGFDEKTVRIGVEYVEGGDEFLQSAGLGSLSIGDAKALVDVMVADVNRRGGLLGRKVVPSYHATGAAEGTSNPQTTAQAVCGAFTDDHQVMAAFLASPAEACLARKRVLSVGNAGLSDDRSLSVAAPFARKPTALSFDHLVPVLVERLAAQGFLTRSSKVGVLYPSSEVGGRVVALLRKQLAARGYQVVADFGFDDSSQAAAPGSVPNAVLPFRSAGVDRVIATGASAAYFMIAAEQQGYRPRYALHSQMNLASVMESVPPKAQLEGAVGVGWLPPNDVAPARMDVRPPAFDACGKHIRASGQNPTGSALYVLTLYCEAVRLFFYAAEKGGGLDSASLQRGLALHGRQYPSAMLLEAGFSQTRMDGALSVRDIRFVPGCGCFRYAGSRRYPA